uniref:hypothetical protein n=1 Tax=Micromonospora acroterricola TaxID=2202421 RepID=UPI001F26872C|nr:hypothetical protein [Micromonospora acroterricola]
MPDLTSALNPFAAEGDRATDDDRGPTADVSAASMTRLRTPFASADDDHETADQTASH